MKKKQHKEHEAYYIMEDKVDWTSVLSMALGWGVGLLYLIQVIIGGITTPPSMLWVAGTLTAGIILIYAGFKSADNVFYKQKKYVKREVLYYE